MANQLTKSLQLLRRRPLGALALLATGVAIACGGGADVADSPGSGTGSTKGSGSSSGTGGIHLGGANSGTGGNGQGSDSGTGGGFTAEGGESFGDGVDYPDDVSFDYDQTEGQGGATACQSTKGEPVGLSRPVDVIFVIDNSSSMSGEIQEVEQNIYQNFAQKIQAANVDYRVIMVSRYGSSTGPDVAETDFQVCIPSPFGITNCTAPQKNALPTPASQPADRRFFHYSADVESLDALCVLLDSYNRPDEFDDQVTTDDGPNPGAYRSWNKQAPNGWQAWLRPEAFKTFVAITDDNVSCNLNEFSNKGSNAGVTFPNVSFTDANADTQFDAQVLALSSTQFGTAAARNYIFHSIIGIKANTDQHAPWAPGDAVQSTKCASASGPGTGYQRISKLTGGLRYPICEDSSGQTNFDPVFQAIADNVIESSAIPCEYDFPTNAPGIIDPALIKVTYTPDGGSAQNLSKVTDSTACGSGNAFYFDDNADPSKVFLCPTACSTVQADDTGKLQLDFGCLGS